MRIKLNNFNPKKLTSIDTYELDVGYFITPELNASVGYYYQQGDLGSANGSGVLGQVAYDISNGLTAEVNISYDEAFETRVSASLKVRLGGTSTTAQRKDVKENSAIKALSSTPENRDVRVHDGFSDFIRFIDDNTFDFASDIATATEVISGERELISKEDLVKATSKGAAIASYLGFPGLARTACRLQTEEALRRNSPDIVNELLLD